MLIGQQSASATSGVPRLTPHLLRQERCFRGQSMVPVLILIP